MDLLDAAPFYWGGFFFGPPQRGRALLWWFRLSRSVTAGLLKAGLVLQIENFGRGSAFHLDL
ncbi:hypothetical protein [Collinsella sp. TF11-5AC]|uniref:hypothetical protein n=1 Tax=Collinsella sp. TF11-5AC TaxID=2292336 RepID=UPI0011C1BA78|nr:hypothetical protein [Collinsella sp. TF11-5AC]